MGKRVHGALTSLRPATDDDVARLVAWHDDADVARYWDAARAMSEHLLDERGRQCVTVAPYTWNEQALRAWRIAAQVPESARADSGTR